MPERTKTATEPSNALLSALDTTSPGFEKNMRAMAELVTRIRNEGEQIREGGGPKAIESQHKKGRLTAPEAPLSMLRLDNNMKGIR